MWNSSRIIKKLCHSNLFYVFASLLALGLYYPVVFSSKLIDIDYDLVIIPLAQIKSLSDYNHVFATEFLLDLQPVRDLSLYIDIKLEEFFHHQMFGIHNLILWLLTCFLAFKIIEQFTKNYIAKFISILLLVHPLGSWVLSWPTARKHILACMLITFATYGLLKVSKGYKRWELWTFIGYFLSLWTQPITILWGGVYFLYLKKKAFLKDFIPLTSLIILAGLIVILTNYIYYDKLYPAFLGVEKINENNSFTNALKILSISRSLTQIFLPISFAANYAYISPLGFIGLPIFLFLIFILKKQVSWGKLLFLIFFCLYPVIFINLRTTNIFVSDTYLLTSLVNTFIVFAFYINQHEISLKRVTPLIIILLFAFSGKTLHETQISTDSLNYFRVSYEREANCKNAVSYAHKLLNDTKLEEFYEISGMAIKNRCMINGVIPETMTSQIYIVRIFMDPDLSIEQKLNALKKPRYITPTYIYIRSHLLLKQGHTELANREIQKLSRGPIESEELIKTLHKRFCVFKNCDLLLNEI